MRRIPLPASLSDETFSPLLEGERVPPESMPLATTPQRSSASRMVILESIDLVSLSRSTRLDQSETIGMCTVFTRPMLVKVATVSPSGPRWVTRRVSSIEAYGRADNYDEKKRLTRFKVGIIMNL